MAFDFLPLMNLAAGFIGQRNANKAITKNNVPTAAELEHNKIIQELMNPDSPLLKRLSERDRQSALEAFQGQIRTMQTADRRNTAMGRQPTFFNPERADEAVSFLTSRAMGPMGAGADELARNRILQAATGYRQMMPAQQGRLDTRMQQGVSNAAYTTALPNQISEILRSLGVGGQQQSRDMGPIIWNDQLPSIHRG